ncbi:MAG: hypothetical protein ABJD11_01775 [Gemmatimonadota bacterium]
MYALTTSLSHISPFVIWVRRALSLVALVFIVLATISGYRALVQVYDLSLEADGVVAPGAVVQVAAISSGRNSVDVRLDLIQSGRVETLAFESIPYNGIASLDPRPARRAFSVVLPAELWNRFHSGAASLRATAIGRSQWLRTPPPTVRERTITLQ